MNKIIKKWNSLSKKQKLLIGGSALASGLATGLAAKYVHGKKNFEDLRNVRNRSESEESIPSEYFVLPSPAYIELNRSLSRTSSISPRPSPASTPRPITPFEVLFPNIQPSRPFRPMSILELLRDPRTKDFRKYILRLRGGQMMFGKRRRRRSRSCNSRKCRSKRNRRSRKKGPP